jgi:hypothetical protein
VEIIRDGNPVHPEITSSECDAKSRVVPRFEHSAHVVVVAWICREAIAGEDGRTYSEVAVAKGASREPGGKGSGAATAGGHGEYGQQEKEQEEEQEMMRRRRVKDCCGVRGEIQDVLQ